MKSLEQMSVIIDNLPFFLYIQTGLYFWIYKVLSEQKQARQKYLRVAGYHHHCGLLMKGRKRSFYHFTNRKGLDSPTSLVPLYDSQKEHYHGRESTLVPNSGRLG